MYSTRIHARIPNGHPREVKSRRVSDKSARMSVSVSVSVSASWDASFLPLTHDALSEENDVVIHETGNTQRFATPPEED